MLHASVTLTLSSFLLWHMTVVSLQTNLYVQLNSVNNKIGSKGWMNSWSSDHHVLRMVSTNDINTPSFTPSSPSSRPPSPFSSSPSNWTSSPSLLSPSSSSSSLLITPVLPLSSTSLSSHAHASPLNPSQLQAVKSDARYVQVLAGPGSGKTRVIAYRIAELIHRGVPASSILALTFTKKAADEMRDRVTYIVGADAASSIKISTIHSFCCRILRQFSDQPNFTIYDDADTLKIVKQLLKSLRNDLMDEYDNDIEESMEKLASASSIRNIISFLKREGAVGGSLSLTHDDNGFKLALSVVEAYQNTLKQNCAKDFDDLVLDSIDMLRKGTKRGDSSYDVITGSYRHILVDEFQDLDTSQFKLIETLAVKEASCDSYVDCTRGVDGRSLFVVGDSNQVIYSWRGANSNNMARFRNVYSSCSVVHLRTNYRSSLPIQVASSAVIADVDDATPVLEETLMQEQMSQGVPDEKVNVVETYDDSGQSACICKIIENLTKTRNVKPDQIAVLYRARRQSLSIEGALTLSNIPYKVMGGTSLIERKEIKDLLAYLRFLSNGEDIESLRRVLNYPARGIGDAMQEIFFDAVMEARRLYNQRRIKESVIDDHFQQQDVLSESIASNSADYIEDFSFYKLLMRFSSDESLKPKKKVVKKKTPKKKREIIVESTEDENDELAMVQTEEDEQEEKALHTQEKTRAEIEFDETYRDFLEYLKAHATTTRLKSVQKAAVMFCELRNECISWEGTLDELILAVFEATGMREQLMKQEEADRKKKVKSAAGKRKLQDKSGRIAAVENIVSIANISEEDTDPEELLFGPTRRLIDFLDMFQLEESLEDSRERIEIENSMQEEQHDMESMKDRGKVKLMTMHASKGLEFDAVIISGIEDGSLPLHGKITHVVGNNEEEKRNVITIEDSQDLHEKEERRLLYVGMTRARKHLYLTHRMKTIVGRKHIPNRKSEFLADLPKEVTQLHRFYDRPRQ